MSKRARCLNILPLRSEIHVRIADESFAGQTGPARALVEERAYMVGASMERLKRTAHIKTLEETLFIFEAEPRRSHIRPEPRGR